MISSEKQQRYDQLRADVDGVFEVTTGIAAVQALHGKRLDDLQLNMVTVMGQLDRAAGKLDRVERVQLLQGTKLDALSKTVEQHSVVLREHSKRFDQLDAKIDGVAERLDAKIDAVADRLDEKFGILDEKFGILDAKIGTVDSKIDGVAGQLNTRIDGVDAKIDKVLALLTAGK